MNEVKKSNAGIHFWQHELVSETGRREEQIEEKEGELNSPLLCFECFLKKFVKRALLSPVFKTLFLPFLEAKFASLFGLITESCGI